MADSRVNPMSATGANMFKEAVCINADRVYDSCSDKDCLEDVMVYFTDCDQPIIDQAISVKCKDVEIINVYLDVEAVPFNKGFYSVDMTFFFAVKVGVLCSPLSEPRTVRGIATVQKKVILFGSEGSVKTFSSEDNRNCVCRCETDKPKAVLQAVDPIALSCKLTECFDRSSDIVCELPACVVNRFEGDFAGVSPVKGVTITLGLFTIVQLERNVQLLIPVYDFCIPDKECVTTTDDPCALFKKIKFPTDEFFPPRLSDIDCD